VLKPVSERSFSRQIKVSNKHYVFSLGIIGLYSTGDLVCEVIRPYCTRSSREPAT